MADDRSEAGKLQFKWNFSKNGTDRLTVHWIQFDGAPAN